MSRMILAGAVAGLVGAAGIAAAAQIKLSDGTELQGEIVQREGARVLVELPRASIQAVDGQPLPPPVAEGAPVPAFDAVDVAGQPVQVSAAGGPVTLVQFWASWCGFCRSDLPTMKRLYADYRDKGLRIMTVSIDDDLDKLRRFIQAEAVPYPVIPAKNYPALSDRFEMQGIPTYFLVDRHGTIVRVWRGALSSSKISISDEVAAVLDNPS